jgi:hypothetical protein
MSGSSGLTGIFFMGCYLLITYSAMGQQLSGRVMQEAQPVPDVHILNISAERATITDENGYFSLLARVGDTIYFSAVQLRRKFLNVTPEMLESEIIVPLEEFVNELDEVVVRPFDLSGDIARDLRQMPAEKPVVASTLGLPNAYVKPPTQVERKIHEATTGGGIVPLNPVLNAITGRTRYLKKILAAERKLARTNRVREFYPDSLFVYELRIPAHKIDDFMYYCEIDTAFSREVDTADRLRIWEYLKRKGEEYRINNTLD